MSEHTLPSTITKSKLLFIKSVLYSDFCACLGPAKGETLCPCALERQNQSRIIDGECKEITFKDTILYCYKCCLPQAIKDMGTIRCKETGNMVPCCSKCSCRTMLTKPISECV